MAERYRSVPEPAQGGLSPWLIPIGLFALTSLWWAYDVFTKPRQQIAAVVAGEAQRPPAKADEDARAAAARLRAAEVEARQRAAAEAKRIAEADAEARQKAEAAAAKARADEEARAARARAEAEAKRRKEAEAAAAAREREAERVREAERRAAAVRTCQANISAAAGAGTLMFDVGRATLKRGSTETLAGIADVLKACPAVRLRVEGHTDGDGGEARNRELSEQRVITVMEQLIRLGIDERQLEGVGYGDTKPIAPNDSARNKALNRRIEFVVEAD